MEKEIDFLAALVVLIGMRFIYMGYCRTVESNTLIHMLKVENNHLKEKINELKIALQKSEESNIQPNI